MTKAPKQPPPPENAPAASPAAAAAPQPAPAPQAAPIPQDSPADDAAAQAVFTQQQTLIMTQAAYIRQLETDLGFVVPPVAPTPPSQTADQLNPVIVSQAGAIRLQSAYTQNLEDLATLIAALPTTTTTH